MDTETAYNLALDYLYSFVDYSLKKADQLAAANFDLDRMRALLAALGNPQDAYPTIHVAGTKGKGSTSAFCAAALQASGRKVGLYTSPHLQDFCERIQINGEPVSHTELVELIEIVKPEVAKIPLMTTFEITTALGFLHFARRKADAAVIEVGLGGRLDATNVITPRVSVITALSYDHMAILGDTLGKIAGEKAGIIKPGIPVVSSPQKQEALEVLEKVAAERGCKLTLVGREVTYSPGTHSLKGQDFSIQQSVHSQHNTSISIQYATFCLPLLGLYQVENATTAYVALKKSGFNLSDAEIAQGFAEVRWPCRFEIANHANPIVIFDSAHNEDSFLRLAQTLEEYFPGRKVTLIFGVSEDKQIAAMLGAIKSKLSHLIVTRADHPRALEPEKIIETVNSGSIMRPSPNQPNVEIEAAAPIETALARALEIARNNGSIVLSAGSMFVTAEVKTAWQRKVVNA
jgi:dihydrofolate synthase / folylpolyglutamate synthase